MSAYENLSERYIIRKVANEVGIKNDIYDIGTDLCIHFLGVISEREKREAFEKEILKATGKPYKVVAFWKN